MNALREKCQKVLRICMCSFVCGELKKTKPLIFKNDRHNVILSLPKYTFRLLACRSVFNIALFLHLVIERYASFLLGRTESCVSSQNSMGCWLKI